MFTGIVEKTATVLSAEDHAGGRRLTVGISWPDLQPGESVCINGTCLTATTFDTQSCEFDVIAETLDKTSLGQLQAGDAVNVERSLQLSSRIDGHFVQGHVDTTAVITRIVSTDEEWRIHLEVEPAFAGYLSPKGSVCLDGVSLTVASLEGPHFSVALIPTTLERTTLGRRKEGDRVNVEFDILTKTVVNWLEQRFPRTEDQHAHV